MPHKDAEIRRAYHCEYMRTRYSTDAEHRRKQLARVRTKYAVKQCACQKCGAPNPEAHHPDYAKPEERVWLCRQCHLLLHGGNNAHPR